VGYHDNGQLFYKGDFKNGEKEGSWVTYHKNGQLYYKGDFKDGKKEGS
jgi:antitoxin component YwqK of YwqJK toxin-antitoxin module